VLFILYESLTRRRLNEYMNENSSEQSATTGITQQLEIKPPFMKPSNISSSIANTQFANTPFANTQFANRGLLAKCLLE